MGQSESLVVHLDAEVIAVIDRRLREMGLPVSDERRAGVAAWLIREAILQRLSEPVR